MQPTLAKSISLPALLAMGMAAMRLKQFLQKPGVRRGSGLLVLAFGIYGLLKLAMHG